MTPTDFPESNIKFTAPQSLEESQCMTISAYWGQVKSGSVDGCSLVVTAWKPTPAEIEDIKNGKPVYFSSIGGLPPHFLTTSFHDATHPA